VGLSCFKRPAIIHAPSNFLSAGNIFFGEILEATLFAIRFVHTSGDTLCPTKCIAATTSMHH
jgi:hypothetical protein